MKNIQICIPNLVLPCARFCEKHKRKICSLLSLRSYSLPAVKLPVPFNQEWIYQSPWWPIVPYDSVYLTLQANTTNQSFFVVRNNLSAHWISRSSHWNFCCWNQSHSKDSSQYLLRFYLCASMMLSMLHSSAHLIFTIDKELGTKSHKLVSGRTETKAKWSNVEMTLRNIIL